MEAMEIQDKMILLNKATICLKSPAIHIPWVYDSCYITSYIFINKKSNMYGYLFFSPNRLSICIRVVVWWCTKRPLVATS